MKSFTLDHSDRRLRHLESEMELEVREELRSDVVEYGKTLANDSTYPPFEICFEVAQSYLSSAHA